MIARVVACVGLVAALSACGVGTFVDDDKFDGCYDRSCVDVPQAVPGVPALVSLSTRTTHVCGLTATGEAWCWGANAFGQLGDGSNEPRNAPVKVTGTLRFTQIAAGESFTCAVATTGAVYCWGIGGMGQLGQVAPENCGTTSVIACAKSPVPVGSLTATAVAAGLRHACALDAAGAAWCWGMNGAGEVGSTAYNQMYFAPRLVSGGEPFTTIGAGDSFNCALGTSGRAWCWGTADRGELGRTVPGCSSIVGIVLTCSATPVQPTTTATFTALSVSQSHSCALTASGVAYCWGDNGQGQLGARNFQQVVGPVIAQGGVPYTAIGASSAATCATPPVGASVCWGLNLFGKLGIGTRLELSATPLAVAGGQRFTAFAGGSYHTCALTADGAAWCWGSGQYGQLGTGPLAP